MNLTNSFFNFGVRFSIGAHDIGVLPRKSIRQKWKHPARKHNDKIDAALRGGKRRCITAFRVPHESTTLWIDIRLGAQEFNHMGRIVGIILEGSHLKISRRFSSTPVIATKHGVSVSRQMIRQHQKPAMPRHGFIACVLPGTRE